MLYTFLYRSDKKGSKNMIFKVWELRTARKLTLRQLQELSGVSKSQINAIENGRANPTMQTLKLLADALGVDLQALYTV